MKPELLKLERSLRKMLSFASDNRLVDSESKDYILVEQILSNLELGKTDFDVKKLKRAVSKIIHPDIVPEQYKGKANAILSNFNSTMDAFEKVPKVDEPLKEASAPKKEATAAEDFYSDSRHQSPFGTDWYSDPRTVHDAKPGPKATWIEPTIFQNFKNWFKYFFRDIPRNSNDYQRIKDRYILWIGELQNRIRDLKNEIGDLKDELSRLDADIARALSISELEKIRQGKINQVDAAYNQMSERIAELAAKISTREEAVAKSKIDVINSRFSEVDVQLLEEFRRFAAVSKMVPIYANSQYPGTNKTWGQIHDEIVTLMNGYFAGQNWATWTTDEFLENLGQVIKNDVVSENRVVRKLRLKLAAFEKEQAGLLNTREFYEDAELAYGAIAYQIEYDYSCRKAELKARLERKDAELVKCTNDCQRYQIEGANFAEKYADFATGADFAAERNVR